MTYLIGLCIGAILGLTGAGGSVVALPLLVGPLNLPVQTAAGMALGAVAVAAATGLLARLRSGAIVWKPGLFFAAVAAAALPLGSYLNPRLLVADKSAFIELMNSLDLPNPKFMDVAVPANRSCGKSKSA